MRSRMWPSESMCGWQAHGGRCMEKAGPKRTCPSASMPQAMRFCAASGALACTWRLARARRRPTSRGKELSCEVFSAAREFAKGSLGGAFRVKPCSQCHRTPPYLRKYTAFVRICRRSLSLYCLHVHVHVIVTLLRLYFFRRVRLRVRRAARGGNRSAEREPNRG